MASEAQWYSVLFYHPSVLTGEMRRAWAMDSLALGPHGAWVEREVLDRALEGSWSPDLAQPSIEGAAWYAVWSTVDDNALSSAAVLQGSLGLTEVGSVFSLKRDAATSIDRTKRFQAALAPLWARSGEEIARLLTEEEDAMTQRIVMNARFPGMGIGGLMRAVDARVSREEFDFEYEADFDNLEQGLARINENRALSITSNAVRSTRTIFYQIAEQNPGLASRILDAVRVELRDDFRRAVLEKNRR